MTPDEAAAKAREIVPCVCDHDDPCPCMGARQKVCSALLAAAAGAKRETRFCPGCESEVTDWNDGSRTDVDPPGDSCCHCHEPVYATAGEAMQAARAAGHARGVEEAARVAETQFRTGTSPQLRPHVAADLIASMIRALAAKDAKGGTDARS